MWIIRFILQLFSDQYTDKRGYKRFKSNGRLVHRVVAEKKLGRKLKSQEVVHHRDRNKTNNTPGNLRVFKNQASHDRQHRKDARRYGKRWSYNGNN